jgi:hypothetical protein
MNCCCVTHILYRNKQSSKVTMLIDIPYYLLSLDYLCYEVGESMAIATWVPAYSWKWQSGGSMLISPNAMAHLTSLWADMCINMQELPYCAHASWELLEAWKFKTQIELGQSDWTLTKKCPAYSTTLAVPPQSHLICSHLQCSGIVCLFPPQVPLHSQCSSPYPNNSDRVWTYTLMVETL